MSSPSGNAGRPASPNHQRRSASPAAAASSHWSSAIRPKARPTVAVARSPRSTAKAPLPDVPPTSRDSMLSSIRCGVARRPARRAKGCSATAGHSGSYSTRRANGAMDVPSSVRSPCAVPSRPIKPPYLRCASVSSSPTESVTGTAPVAVGGRVLRSRLMALPRQTKSPSTSAGPARLSADRRTSTSDSRTSLPLAASRSRTVPSSIVTCLGTTAAAQFSASPSGHQASASCSCTSRTRRGPTRASRSTSMLPRSSGSRATRTFSASIVRRSSWAAGSGADRRTPAAENTGVGSSLRSTSPSMLTGPPRTSESGPAIHVLRAFQSMKPGAARSVVTARASRTRMPISRVLTAATVVVRVSSSTPRWVETFVRRQDLATPVRAWRRHATPRGRCEPTACAPRQAACTPAKAGSRCRLRRRDGTGRLALPA